MPHFTIEYSANLDDRIDFSTFCEALRGAAVATGVFPLGGIRIRALKCADYAIADAAEENAFVDISLRMGRGRDLETRRQAGQVVFDAADAYLGDLFDDIPLALSFEVREIDPDLSFKKNSIHQRLKAHE
ncbi:5-carboxymethyl-2-hydroxymuconate Delta-isomerase [Pelagibius sp. Alg239-R121]|uniref:5-carboxymethyl-2-hydroxymuconate Delta-isomerase n=1 Tax=Pelagibius sp. Alg239-R121 TaxID=2993448 RepID=UPI0024A64440|nr:5-carboxymethyl-2-hydroxymuconate Delta-isomerase [Pelagibius sp. Alg239-R121]